MALNNKLGFIKGVKVAIQDGGDTRDWEKYPVNGSVVKDGKNYKFSISLDYDSLLKIDVKLSAEALYNMLIAVEEEEEEDRIRKATPFSEEYRRKTLSWDDYEPWD